MLFPFAACVLRISYKHGDDRRNTSSRNALDSLALLVLLDPDRANNYG